MKPYFYNAHTHIFNLDHVPDHLAKGYFSVFGRTISISWLRRIGALQWLLQAIPKLFGRDDDISMAERLVNMVRHGLGEGKKARSQESIFRELKGYYPRGTRFVVLPMDMEYMDAGRVPVGYRRQIEELAALKQNPLYREVIYPFIFADPRRFEAEPDYFDYVKTQVEAGVFSGIKMYPALGYWPFDERLKPVYDLCLQKNLPIMSHCVQGIIHYRGKKQYHRLPVAPDVALDEKKPKEYCTHFSNPLSMHCLLDPDIISAHWNIPRSEAEAYQHLKICLAHFGGSEEWKRYLRDPWYPKADDGSNPDPFPSLKKENWNFSLKPQISDYSWFSIIREMMERYPNVYADISFMLYDKEIWPLLKVLLSRKGNRFRERVLFGTDHYVVAQKGTERELSLGIRAFLGEELFKQIALTNVEEYLETRP